MNQTLNKKLTYGLFVGFIRNAFDYFNFTQENPSDPNSAFRQNPVTGNQRDLEIWGEFKPIDPLRFNFSYRKARLDHNGDDDKLRAFDSDIVSLKTTYQFTRFMFTRVRIDYLSDERRYAAQALVGLNTSPGTAVYVGYNDLFSYNGFDNITGQHQPKFFRESRTFFIRASYLFRKSFK